MADLWEMCRTEGGGFWIWSPGKRFRYVTNIEYAKSKGEKYNDRDDTISLLLADGWQPFAFADRDLHLRRKLNS